LNLIPDLALYFGNIFEFQRHVFEFVANILIFGPTSQKYVLTGLQGKSEVSANFHLIVVQETSG